MSAMVTVYVLRDIYNTEVQLRASDTPQEVPASVVEKYPSVFADTLEETSADTEPDTPGSDEEE